SAAPSSTRHLHFWAASNASPRQETACAFFLPDIRLVNSMMSFHSGDYSPAHTMMPTNDTEAFSFPTASENQNTASGDHLENLGFGPAGPGIQDQAHPSSNHTETLDFSPAEHGSMNTGCGTSTHTGAVSTPHLGDHMALPFDLQMHFAEYTSADGIDYFASNMLTAHSHFYGDAHDETSLSQRTATGSGRHWKDSYSCSGT
ncbi:hypothetical protein CC86DRAFT_428470, partial [Ophiobolus disseminans]